MKGVLGSLGRNKIVSTWDGFTELEMLDVRMARNEHTIAQCKPYNPKPYPTLAIPKPRGGPYGIDPSFLDTKKLKHTPFKSRR